MPPGVVGQLRIVVARDEAEEGGGDHPNTGNAVRGAEGGELLDVGELSYVDLLGQLAAYGRLHILVGPQAPAGKGPASCMRLAGPLPQQDLK